MTWELALVIGIMIGDIAMLLILQFFIKPRLKKILTNYDKTGESK
jgi:hypothetical protein